MGELRDMFAAGEVWPAFALALIGLTAFVRRHAADQVLRWIAARVPGDDAAQVTNLRAFVPLGLAALAFWIAVTLPTGISVQEAAYTALLSAFASMAGKDTADAFGVMLRVLLGMLPNRKERPMDENTATPDQAWPPRPPDDEDEKPFEPDRPPPPPPPPDKD
jgi:hypothetical protein